MGGRAITVEQSLSGFIPLVMDISTMSLMSMP